MMRKEVLKQFFLDNFLVIGLITIGSVAWTLTMFKSGMVSSYGMGFWGANGHDGVWHIALIESLLRGKFEMPVFSGELIKNYHIGFDILVAFVHSITRVPVVNLYFQVFPFIIALLTGIATNLFVSSWTRSKLVSLWAVFFVYFGGDAAWIFGKGESTFWSQQAISTLINPPFALSLVFILFGLYFLTKRRVLLAIICLGLLVEIKAYAGILVIGSLSIASLWEMVRERKYTYFKVLVGTLILSFSLFFIFNQGSENVFEFSPFWFLGTLFNLDRFSIPRLASAIANYNLAHNSLKLAIVYIFAFGIFWVGNMWTRLLKEIEVIRWIRNRKEITSMDIFFTSVIMAGAIIPMLFIQRGTPWNTIQFFYYSLTFSGLLAGVGIKRLLEGRSETFRIIFTTIVILITIPTTAMTLIDVYLPVRPPAVISEHELEALNFLARQEQGIVLTYPYDSLKAKEAEANPPRPIYLYESTAYVSAFSKKSVFLEDEVNLNITGFDWKTRRQEVMDKLLNTLNQDEAREFLRRNNIKYVYWVKPQRAKLGEAQLGLKRIFENKQVDIYSVSF